MIKLAGRMAGYKTEIGWRYDVRMSQSPCKKVASLVRGRGVAGACAHVLEVIKQTWTEWLEERSSLARRG